MTSLIIHRAGPALSVQDLGRPNAMAYGLSRGGAADPLALLEGAALLGNAPESAAIEMPGLGGTFEVTHPTRIALTGAPMQVDLDGKALVWNASHQIEPGQKLTIQSVIQGTCGYLHVAGGLQTKPFLGSRSAHLAAKIGGVLQAGDALPITQDPSPQTAAYKLPIDPRFQGGTIRVLPSVHTDRFSPETLSRFQATEFHKTPRANRQGAELAFQGDPFSVANQLSILSDPMIAGDIQMTGTGQPFVLLPECQTTGGYPRIATVLPQDLPKVAQAPITAALTFRFVDADEAQKLHVSTADLLKQLAAKRTPLIRDPHDMADLLSYQLVGGVVSAKD